jgi:hypothetical protein
MEEERVLIWKVGYVICHVISPQRKGCADRRHLYAEEGEVHLT